MISLPGGIAALLLQDCDGDMARFWPLYVQVMAWSARNGELKMFGPFCLN